MSHPVQALTRATLASLCLAAAPAFAAEGSFTPLNEPAPVLRLTLGP